MKKKILLLLLPCSLARAQTASPSVPAVAGDFYSSTLFTVSATIGELAAVETFSKPALILTQGFQQPAMLPVGIQAEPEAVFGGTVFPNPFKDDAYLAYTLASPAGVLIELYDLLGNRLRTEYFEEGPGNYVHKIPSEELINGIYLLRVKCLYKNNESQINTFKLSVNK